MARVVVQAYTYPRDGVAPKIPETRLLSVPVQDIRKTVARAPPSTGIANQDAPVNKVCYVPQGSVVGAPCHPRPSRSRKIPIEAVEPHTSVSPSMRLLETKLFAMVSSVSSRLLSNARESMRPKRRPCRCLTEASCGATCSQSQWKRGQPGCW